MRIVSATVVAEPGVVLHGAEVEFDASGVRYLGPVRGPAQGGDLDAAGGIVIPGMTNAHTHSAMTLLRGYSDDVELQTWLTQIRPFELRMTAADMAAGLRLAMVEMMRSGTVAFCDMFGWTAELLGEVSAAGMRVSAAPTVFDYVSAPFPTADPRTGAELLDATPALAAEFAADPLVRVTYGLHAPYTCPPELIVDAVARARRDDLGVQIHLSETRYEVEESLRQRGLSPIAHVAGLGLLDLPVHVAHAVHPVEGDVDLLAAASVTVSHNPVSNLKLGAGVAPVTRYRDAGVRLSLGTDSAASNNTLDLFEELKLGPLLQRGVLEDSTALLGAEVLGWATRGGALAAGAGGTGRIRVGEPADLVVLGVASSRAVPMHDPESFVCYAATGADVTDVFVAGRQIVGDGRVLTLDEAAVRADVAERTARIRAELAAGA